MALEDAHVLAEMLLAADEADDALPEAVGRRRMPRVGIMVDASRQIVRWTLDRDPGNVPGLQARIVALVTGPA